MSRPSEWVNLTEELTPTAIEKIKEGDMMVFDYEGSRNEYKVVEANGTQVWVKPAKTYSLEEVGAKWTDEGLELHTTKSHDVDLGED